jgi:hypothetical protein
MLVSELLGLTKISAAKIYKYIGHKELAISIVKKLDEFKKTRTNHYIFPDELLAIHDSIPLYGNAIAIVRKELAKMKAWQERKIRPDAVVPQDDVQPDWVVYEDGASA